MRNDRRQAQVRFGVITIVLCMCCQGCFTHSMEMGGRNIKKATVARIQPNVTTKADILEWFGQPQAIIKPDDTGPVYSGGGLVYSGGAPVMAGSANLFELFSSKHRISSSHRIYVFSYGKMSGGTLALPLLGAHSSKWRTKKLLVLLDASDDVVDDYNYDEQ